MNIIKKLKSNINTIYLSNKYYYEIYTKTLNELIKTENIYVIKKKLEQQNVITKKSLDVALYTNNIEIIKLIVIKGGKISSKTIDLCISLENTDIIKVIKHIDKYNEISPFSFCRIIYSGNYEYIKTYIALYNIYVFFEDNLYYIIYDLEKNLLWTDFDKNVIKLVFMHLYTNNIKKNLEILKKYNIIMTEKEFIIYYNKNVKEFNSIIESTKKIFPIKDIINNITKIIPNICDIIIQYNYPEWNLI